MVKEIRIKDGLYMSFGTRKGFGLGIVIDKWTLSIDFGIFWMALDKTVQVAWPQEAYPKEVK